MTDAECDIMDDTDGTQRENYIVRLGETPELMDKLDDEATGEDTARQILMDNQYIWKGTCGER